MRARRPAARTLFALPAGVALLVGIDAGLSLLDAWPPVNSGRLGEVHGVLMVLGFVGTLVALQLSRCNRLSQEETRTIL